MPYVSIFRSSLFHPALLEKSAFFETVGQRVAQRAPQADGQVVSCEG